MFEKLRTNQSLKEPQHSTKITKAPVKPIKPAKPFNELTSLVCQFGQ